MGIGAELQVPAVRPGPFLRDDLLLELGLPSGQICRGGESFDPFGVIGRDDAKFEAAFRQLARLTPYELATPLEPPEHGSYRTERTAIA